MAIRKKKKDKGTVIGKSKTGEGELRVRTEVGPAMSIAEGLNTINKRRAELGLDPTDLEHTKFDRDKLETFEKQIQPKREASSGDIIKGLFTGKGPGSIAELSGLEPGQLQQGVGPPITPAGPIAAGLYKGAKVTKAAGVNAVSQASKFKNAFPTSTSDIVKYSKNLNVANSKVFASNSIAQFGRTNLGIAIKGAATVGAVVASADTLATWYAADNIRSSMPFQMNAIVDGVQSGAISEADADELMTQMDRQLQFTTETIDKSTRLNPALWAARKRYMVGLETTQTAVDTKRLLAFGR